MEDNAKHISLSKETLIEVLRCLSRKQLSQKCYLVNREIHNLATSRPHVPNIHIINELCFENTPCIIKGQIDEFGEPSKPKRNYFVRVGSGGIPLTATFLATEMPVPEHFIRFRQVTLGRFQEEYMIKFLEGAKNSFVGCQVTFPASYGQSVECKSIADFSHHKSAQEQMQHLLENVFHRPLHVAIHDTAFADLKVIIQKEGVKNCNVFELTFEPRWCSNETNSAFMDWLKIESNVTSQSTGIEKHLILKHYSGKFVADMVQSLKKDFENVTEPSPNFAITFSEIKENLLEYIRNDPTFSIDNNQTGERLSFFKSDLQQCLDQSYRLWRRRIPIQDEDSNMTSTESSRD
ncbi:hypothetical protein DdX_12934 [Ditylenchus destructor]|uniref:Uncharacterized protein n=1 Tax=Ditylenchus destructor TaxID=166010 RepID=A0AAD4MX98_9BILA|nr:hypothetical protein DdX_12934 [Ditylenchus destructor]